MDESVESIKKLNKPKQISTDIGVFQYEYVEVYFDTISKFYTNDIEGISSLYFVQGNQVNEKQLRTLIKEFAQIKVLREDPNISKKQKKTREN